MSDPGVGDVVRQALAENIAAFQRATSSVARYRADAPRLADAVRRLSEWSLERSSHVQYRHVGEREQQSVGFTFAESGNVFWLAFPASQAGDPKLDLLVRMSTYLPAARAQVVREKLVELGVRSSPVRPDRAPSVPLKSLLTASSFEATLSFLGWVLSQPDISGDDAVWRNDSGLEAADEVNQVSVRHADLVQRSDPPGSAPRASMVQSARGFGHFDTCNRENFAAALILLSLDEDKALRSMFADLIRNTGRLPSDAELQRWGREEDLAAPEGRIRRSDLWLDFDRSLVLLEVKTRSDWKREHVIQQMRDQQNASVGNGCCVDKAVLLSPGPLHRYVGDDVPFRVSWQDLLRKARELTSRSRVLDLSIAHWENIVSRDFGLAETTRRAQLNEVVAQAGCIVAFLREALLRVGGSARNDTVWFSGADGAPRQLERWAWHGIAVPGEIRKTSRVYLGLYEYVHPTPEEERGLFLELYLLGEERETLLPPIPVKPPLDLSQEGLAALLQVFVAAFAKASPPPAFVGAEQSSLVVLDGDGRA